MAKINFDKIVRRYAPGSEVWADDGSSIRLQAVGYRASALIFRGQTAAVQVPANYRPGHVDVALFELQGDDGVDYHCLTHAAGRLALMTASEPEVQWRSDGGLYLPSMGLTVAGEGRHSFSSIGAVRLESVPLVPEYPPLSPYAGIQHA